MRKILHFIKFCMYKILSYKIGMYEILKASAGKPGRKLPAKVHAY